MAASQGHRTQVKLSFVSSPFHQDERYLLLNNSDEIIIVLSGTEQGLKNSLWRTLVGNFPIKEENSLLRGDGKSPLF